MSAARVVGAGLSGLTAAWRLHPDNRATLRSLAERREYGAELFHERLSVSLTTLRASAS